ncbi:MAG: hypothetical protein QOI99_2421 [Actinomycetota bacterium]|jgi:uncharacterized integral membrane protein|nr:hypothetical protein [Actinomycetota bacterium]
MPTDRREVARIVALVVAVLVLLALAIDNRQSVRIGYVVGDVKAPLLVVLLIAAVLGGLVARLVEWRTGRTRR